MKLGLAGALPLLLILPCWQTPEDVRRASIDPELINRINVEPSLRSFDGVLGVRAMRWEGESREALFAWFEDKAAALDWYYSAEHVDAAEAMLTKSIDRQEEPLAHVADDSGPLLIIFYVAADPTAEIPDGLSLPLTALSMEIYQPLPGGTSIRGRFTPESVEIPHHARLLER